MKQKRAAAAAYCDRACGADLDLSLIIADGPTELLILLLKLTLE